MNFLSKDDAGVLEKKQRGEVAKYRGPKFVLYYESAGRRDYGPAANAIVQSTGAFSEAAVLFLFALGADGLGEHPVKDQRWSRYRKWRAANGEDRRLFEAPAHQFEAHEFGQFSKVTEFALELGWDALVAAKPGRQILFLSHDDRLEIYRSFDGRRLVRDLTGLGYWRER